MEQVFESGNEDRDLFGELVKSETWLAVLGRTVGWFDFVRDDHEKLWYNGGDYRTVILADYKVYGCNDFIPIANSEVVYIGEMSTWGGME